MPIVTSTYRLDDHPQADGSIWVYESHADHNGLTHPHSYLAAPGTDYEAVLQARAANLSAAIDAKEALEAEARQYHLSISPADFLGRFTPQEWAAFKALAQTDDTAAYLRAMFEKATYVNTNDIRITQAVQFLQSAGILTAARAAEVLA